MKNEYEVRGNVVAIKLKRMSGNEPLEAMIDVADLERVQARAGTWYATGAVGRPYAVTTTTKNGKKAALYMHRWIMQPPDEMFVDHINRDTLDNRRVNLRVVTPAENAQNSGGGLTGVSGVRELAGKYQASFRNGGARYHVGTYDTIAEAASDLRFAREVVGVRTVA